MQAVSGPGLDLGGEGITEPRERRTIYNEIISSLRQVLTEQGNQITQESELMLWAENANEWRNRILWQPNAFQRNSTLHSER